MAFSGKLLDAHMTTAQPVKPSATFSLAEILKIVENARRKGWIKSNRNIPAYPPNNKKSKAQPGQ